MNAACSGRSGSIALSLTGARLRNSFRSELRSTKLRTVLAVAHSDRTRSASAMTLASTQVATQHSPSIKNRLGSAILVSLKAFLLKPW